MREFTSVILPLMDKPLFDQVLQMDLILSNCGLKLSRIFSSSDMLFLK